jgi:hypothetical protein
MDDAAIKQSVKEKYGLAATRVKAGGGCCRSDGGASVCDPISSNLYSAAQTQEIPEDALQASRLWQPVGIGGVEGR